LVFRSLKLHYAPRRSELPAWGASGARHSCRFSVRHKGGQGFANAAASSREQAEACAPQAGRCRFKLEVVSTRKPKLQVMNQALMRPDGLP